MRVGEARRLARAWIDDRARGLSGFEGAFLTGSAIWTPDDAPLPPTSDVDVMIVLRGPIPPVKLGKVEHDGVLLDVTYLAADEVQSAEVILGSYYLAPSFARPSIVLDPTGRLQALSEAVAPEYPRRRWIRARCEHGWSNAARHFGALKNPSLPWHVQVIIWLFGTAAATIVLLCAGLRNPTVRTRYLAVRRLLADYGMPDRYEPLLDDLGCAHLAREQVMAHIAPLEAAFDEAAQVIRSPVFFASDISARARPISIDGSRDLIEQSDHREAVFYMVATYARCQDILSRDGTPGQYGRHLAGFNALLADLGIHDSEDIARRTAQVEARMARVWRTAESIMAANPEAVD